MIVKRVTSVLFVEEIEPCVAFWTERLGFAKVIEVPEGPKLGFVMLQKDGTEIMYQSYASVDNDVPTFGSALRQSRSFLYIEVDNLDAVKAAIKNAEVYLPERTTFYGAREIGVRDPAGHYLTFAQFPGEASK